MSKNDGGGVHWGAVAFGWVVAVLAGFILTPLLSILYERLTGIDVQLGKPTGTATIVSVASGFVAYLIGGYAAARRAREAGGKTGVLTAVFGLVVGLVLASLLSALGVVFTGGVALPPVAFGLAREAHVAGLLLLSVNLFAAYVGGKLGEPWPDIRNPF